MLEAALLRTLRFLPSQQRENEFWALERLSLSVRGVAHPVAAAYLRAFLARMAHDGKNKRELTT